MTRVAMLGALGLLTSMVVAVTPVQAAPSDLHIDVGRDFNVGSQQDPRSASSMRFYAPLNNSGTPTIRVEEGSTITFHGGFHTATLLPQGMDSSAWIDDNLFNPDSPWAFLQNDPDGAEMDRALSSELLGFASACLPDCPTGTYDGTAMSSAALFNYMEFPPEAPPIDHGFSVTLSPLAVDPGDVVWVVCSFHPAMKLKIVIHDGTAASTTQAEIDAAGTSLRKQDRDHAASLWQKLATTHTSRMVNGTKVWDAWSGYDTRHLSLFGMFPSELNVKPGQKVRWHFSHLIHEDHSVTSPVSFASTLSQGPPPSCDTGSSEDLPADFTQQPPCPEGSTFEVELDDRIFEIIGDGKVTSATDKESSAARGSLAPLMGPPRGDGYTLSFPKELANPWKYACNVHGNSMVGKIKVE